MSRATDSRSRSTGRPAVARKLLDLSKRQAAIASDLRLALADAEGVGWADGLVLTARRLGSELEEAAIDVDRGRRELAVADGPELPLFDRPVPPRGYRLVARDGAKAERFELPPGRSVDEAFERLRDFRARRSSECFLEAEDSAEYPEAYLLSLPGEPIKIVDRGRVPAAREEPAKKPAKEPAKKPTAVTEAGPGKGRSRSDPIRPNTPAVIPGTQGAETTPVESSPPDADRGHSDRVDPEEGGFPPGTKLFQCTRCNWPRPCGDHPCPECSCPEFGLVVVDGALRIVPDEGASARPKGVRKPPKLWAIVDKARGVEVDRVEAPSRSAAMAVAEGQFPGLMHLKAERREVAHASA